jgi:predicted Zn-dependent protease
MLTREDTKKLTGKILSYSTYPECSVSISSSEQAFTRFANNGITTAALVNRHSVSISSIRDGRSGRSVVNDLDENALRTAVKQSEELAGIAPPNPEHRPPLGPQEYRDTKDFDEKTARARAPEMLPHIQAIVQIAKGKKLVAAGLFERIHSVSAIANKNGLFGFHASADSKLTTTIRNPEGTSSGWAGLASTRISEIDGSALGEIAAGKCLRWKNPKRIDPGQYTVVFEPTATGDLVHLMPQAFSARATEEGRTFLSKRGGGSRIDEKMFPEMITLRSDPFDGRLPAAPWAGGEGGLGGGGGRFGGGGDLDPIPAERVNWIEKGVVKNLAFDRYWAQKTGHAPVPFANALFLDGGEATLEELIKSVDRGLLVTHFWYIRFVNPQTLQHTGLTRDGLFLIENGKISDPVMNLRFNDSPVRLLQRTVKLGRASRMRGLEGASMLAPALVATDFTFTSISDAV